MVERLPNSYSPGPEKSWYGPANTHTLG